MKIISHRLKLNAASLTSDLSIVGHAHTAHAIVGCSCDFAGTSSSMSGKRRRVGNDEDYRETNDQNV